MLDECLHTHFRKQAKKTPDKIAVFDLKRKITYGELDKRTDELANYLYHEYHVKPDDPIGIYMDKSLEYVISYIAILKAGGGYTPIDVLFPPKMIEGILGKIHMKCVLTKNIFSKNLPPLQKYFSFEDFEKKIVKNNFFEKKFIETVKPHNSAYFPLSSGTTGEPKMIRCPHMGALNSYIWRFENFPYEENEREACNIFFIWELLRPLLRGITLYIVPQEIIYDPNGLCEFIHKNKITRILLTSSTLQTIFDLNFYKTELLVERFDSIKMVILNGEVVTTSLYNMFKKVFPKKKLVNLYSISECAGVTSADIDDLKSDDKYCSTGFLMQNVFGYIMDPVTYEILPRGEVGELYVGGINLATEYVGQEKLTKERFIPNPHNFPSQPKWIKEKRLYRVGDYARFLDDNSIEILGRCNSMVKIRGYSIELNAIQSYLNKFELISSSVVVKDSKRERIIAYIVFNENVKKEQISGVGIKNFLKEQLPFYLIPDVLVRLDKLPINLEFGKLDTKKLPYPDDHLHLVIPLGNKIVKPENKNEEELLELWKQVFDVDQLSVEDNFFDLGGNSLLLAKLYEKMKLHFKKIKKRFTLPLLYTYNTIRTQVLLLSRENKNEIDWKKEIMFELDKKRLRYPKSYPRNFNNIFLTGATGYLGAFLLYSLLKKFPESKIFCLVRKINGKERLKSNLEKYGLILMKGDIRRIKIIKGDFSQKNFELSEERFLVLQREIDIIVHCGASVNFLKSYNELKGSNVQGTKNVVIFSVENKRMIPIMYVSTNGVFLRNNKFNAALERDTDYEIRDPKFVDELEMGYCQSKYIAEKILIKCVMKYNLPIAIFRPGDIACDCKEGRYNPHHDFITFIRGVIDLKMAPRDYRMIDLSPVDVISDTITQKMKDFEFENTQKKFQFNLVHPNQMRIISIIQYLKEILGYKIKIISPKHWIKEVKKKRSNPCYTLYPIFKKRINEKDIFYENSLWKMEDLPDPKILLKKIINRLILDGKVKRSVKTRIFSKSAIVTGSSKGIGKQIAIDLLKNGVNVCISGRSEEILKKICKEFSKDKFQTHKFYGKLIYKKCDVTKTEEMEEMVKYSLEHFGKIDYFVCNAGIMPATLMKNCSVFEWKRCVDVNVNGLLNSVGSILKHLIDNKMGHMVFISSDAGVQVWETLTVYSATKFFMEAIVKGLRLECSKYGIKFTSIQPGDVGWTQILEENQSDKEGLKRLEEITAKKLMVPSDISKAVLYALKQTDNCAINEILIEPVE